MSNLDFLYVLLFALLQSHKHTVAQTSLTYQGYTSVPNKLINPNVTGLCLDGNNIATINSSTDFANLHLLLNLSLQYNKFDEIPFMPNIASSLSSLILSFNQIKKVNSTRVQVLVKLTTLDLTSNFLTTFPDFYHLSLISLFLGSNQIRTFPKLPMIGANLKQLVIEFNLIESIDISTLAQYAKLSYMNINYNNVATFPNSCFGMGSLFYMTGRGNNWNCDCRLRWILTAKKKYEFLNYSEIMCSNPPLLAGYYLLNLPLSQLNCDGTYAFF